MLGIAVTIVVPELSANGNLLPRCGCSRARGFGTMAPPPMTLFTLVSVHSSLELLELLLHTDPLRRILWSDATCSWRWTFLLVEEMADDGRFSH